MSLCSTGNPNRKLMDRIGCDKCGDSMLDVYEPATVMISGSITCAKCSADGKSTFSGVHIFLHPDVNGRTVVC